MREICKRSEQESDMGTFLPRVSTGKHQNVSAVFLYEKVVWSDSGRPEKCRTSRILLKPKSLMVDKTPPTRLRFGDLRHRHILLFQKQKLQNNFQKRCRNWSRWLTQCLCILLYARTLSGVPLKMPQRFKKVKQCKF